MNEQINHVINVDDCQELSKREKLVHASIAHFWGVWRKGYLTSLRGSQKLTKSKKEPKLMVNDIVIVYDKRQPRHLWKLGRITELIIGKDDVIRGAKLKLGTGAIIQRPLNLLYLLEVRNFTKNVDDENNDEKGETVRPKRGAATMGELKRKFMN